MYIQSTNIWKGSHEYSIGKGQCLQQMVLGKLDIHIQKNEVGPLPYSFHKT